MTDAVSNIKLGIETGNGKADLTSLREEFTLLRKEIVELNSLKANAQGLVGGAKTAQGELATLGAELKASVAKVNELEQQLAKLGKSQAANAKAATDSVATETKKQFDIQITSAKNIQNEIAAIEAKTTEKVKSEQAKRYAMGQSAKVGGVSYSMKDSSNEGDFSKALKESERVRREILASSQTMLIADIERGEARRREVLATSQTMLIAETERSEALRREKLSTSQTMLIADVERSEARRREVLATSQTMQMAEIDRAEAKRREKLAVSQAMQIAEIERAEVMKREKNATAQAMQIAEIDRAEAKKIEVARVARDMQMAEIDRAEQHKREKNTTAQSMLIADIERAEQIKNEITRNARDIQMAEIDRADALRIQKQRTANDMLIADTKRAEEERQLLMNSKFQAATPQGKVTTLRSASALVGDGTDQRRVTLATNRYGADAVGEIRNIAQYEQAAAIATRNSSQATLQNTAARREAQLQNRSYAEGLREINSASKGLAAGLGSLWATWGSMVPLVAGAAIAGSLVKTLEAGKDVEYQLQFLRALSSGDKQGIDFDSFLHISEGTMSSLKEAAGGMRALSQAGLDQHEALLALPSILNLATIGEMSVGAAALSATGVVNAFNLSLADIGHVGDVFAKVAASSNTSVQGMTESMKQASTVGEMFHLTMEEAAASIGVMAQRNITGTAAGTALTTALKNLYEPSAKAAAAMKAMNLTTDDGHGGLKGYNQLLDELRAKLLTLNDASQAVFLGTISDQRGAKALSALTHNMDEYKKFLDDATRSTGFMSQATLELQDTVQGSMQRMSNTIDHTFVEAFRMAEPEVRRVIGSLTDLAKSNGVVSFVSELAVGVANLTKFMVDHVNIIKYAAIAYVGLKVISGLVNGYVNWRASLALTNLQLAANTTAVGVNTTVLTLEAEAANAAGAGMVRLAGGLRFAMAAAGPLALAVMGVVAAYELLSVNMDKTDVSNRHILNTADTIIDYYNRQIESVSKLNDELERKNKLNGVGDTTADKQHYAEMDVALDKANKDVESKRKLVPEGGSQASQHGAGAYAEMQLQKAVAFRDELQKKYDEEKELRGKSERTDLRNKDLRGQDKTVETLKTMLADSKNGNEKTKALSAGIQEMLTEARSNEHAYEWLGDQVKAYQEKMNEARGTFTVPKKGGEGDAYRSQQSELDGKLQEIKDKEKSKLDDVKSRLASHEIGDLQAVALNLKIVKDARAEEIKVYKEKVDLARDNGKLNDAQKSNNDIKKQDRASTEADNDAERERHQTYAKWAADDLKVQGDTLRKRGELIKAFQAEFDSKNAGEISSLNKDLDSGELPLLDRVKASRRLDSIQGQRSTGTEVATFDELQDKFDSLANDMQEQLAKVAEKASQSNGFFSDVGAAQAGQDIRDKMLPSIDEVVDRMRGIANSLNDKGLQSSVSKMSTTMIKEADKSKTAWIAAGKSISQSLGDAFGKSGKAAGGVVEALVKQRMAQKDIDNDLAKSKKEDPAKTIEAENKARKESAELQISSYASIAGAAKGFFDEHSKGYEAMQAAEQVFRAFELAEALKNFLVKNSLIAESTVLALFGDQAKSVSAVTSATAQIAAETAVQEAKGVTAIINQAGGDQYTAWARMAMMAAAVAALGIMVSGGTGGGTPPVDISKERQKYNGTGYTYNSQDTSKNPYDWELEKSDSLSKSLEKMKDNSDIALRFSSSQLAQLQNISTGISGLTSSLVSTVGIRGTKADEAALGVGSSKSFANWSSSSTSLTDSGISFDRLSGSSMPTGNSLGDLIKRAGMTGTNYVQNLAQTIGTVLANGVKASSFADVHTESRSGWFGIGGKDSDDSTKYTPLEANVTDNMTSVITSMYTTISDAAKFLGRDNASLEASLKSVTLQEAGLDKISLKGLSSDEVDKQLNAAFSNLGDVMAKRAMPGLEAFKNGAETYLTTLVRVSSGVDTANYALQKLGVTAESYTQVVNKQGDVATEIVRDSLVNKESFSTKLRDRDPAENIFHYLLTGFKSATTGIGQIIESMSGSVDDLTAAYTQLNDVRRTMSQTGASNADVTTSMIRGAGGLDKLSSGINDYLDKFFSEGEKAAAKVSTLQDQFKQIGTPMPKSIDDFKRLVTSIDRTTDAGQTLYGSLVSLAGEFGDLADSSGIVNPALAKQKAAVTELVKTADKWVDLIKNSRDMILDIDTALSSTGVADHGQRINELQNLINSGSLGFEQQLELAGELKDLVLEKYQTEKQNALDLINYGKDLNKYVNTLLTGDMSPLTNKQKLETAQGDYNTTLANTQSSDKDVRDQARSDIQGKADTLLDLARTYYASSQNYKDIFNAVSGQLGDLGNSSIQAGNSINDQSQQEITELQKLRDLAQNINDTSRDEYLAIVKQVDSQVDALQSMASSLGVLSGLPEILSGLSSQLAADIGLEGVNGAGVNGTGSDQIKNLYQSVLGRQADAGGLAFWVNAYKNGQSIDTIKDSLMSSTEYANRPVNGSHANGLDYVPFDGYVAELHEGESVLTATEAKARRTNKAAMASTASFSQSEKSEMAAEIAELRKSMDLMIDAQNQGTQAVVRALGSTSDQAAEKIVKGTKDAIGTSDYDNRNKPAFQ